MAITTPIDISNTSAESLMKMADAVFYQNGRNKLIVYVNRPISQYLSNLYKSHPACKALFFDDQLINQCLSNVAKKVEAVTGDYYFHNINNVPCYLTLDLLKAWEKYGKGEQFPNFGYLKILSLVHLKTDTELVPMEIIPNGYLSSENLTYSLIHKVKYIIYGSPD